MSNDDRPSSNKSTKAAQQNKISHRDRKHPWHLPYLKTCIIKEVNSKGASVTFLTERLTFSGSDDAM